MLLHVAHIDDAEEVEAVASHSLLAETDVLNEDDIEALEPSGINSGALTVAKRP